MGIQTHGSVSKYNGKNLLIFSSDFVLLNSPLFVFYNSLSPPLLYFSCHLPTVRVNNLFQVCLILIGT